MSLDLTTEALLAHVERICAERDAARKRVERRVARLQAQIACMEAMREVEDEMIEVLPPKPETDWSTVKRGTRVNVWSIMDSAGSPATYITYCDELPRPHVVLRYGTDAVSNWKYCELVEEGDE